MATPKQQRINPKSVPARRPNAGKSGRPGGRPPGVAKVRKATARDWISGARLQTLPLAIAPIALGTAAAYVLPHEDAGPGWHWFRAILCLVVALSLQIAVNFANDYSDGIRGTDKHRVGPRRLTASGAAKPRTVFAVALVFFGIAAIAGLIIVIRTQQWWLLAIGAVAIVAAYFYTGGKRPYGYFGLGELFVFVFFGIVATAGTTFVLAGTVTLESWLSAVAIGLIACAVLMVNNIRDIEQDKLAGKRTLAVLIGNRASRIVFGVLLLAPFGILSFFTLFYANAYLVYFALLAAIPAVGITISAKTSAELIVALRLSALVALVYGLGLGWAIAF
ncbi:1,4-dihydroxy-2-naphthoate polyprenyltransferase [Salinibacterium xinjiangense]|uniref:1,4-dihydroxy-2-naphthoate polyprenyltransferase n=1 Tax=Salinibacterium xinjiangense TaxID=386302 RepID=UPI000BE470F9|nr:1,4-dihydroxy-2-naphthoate polyprenyltransferase [Salinibacterium xinjiangense]